jgi:hypothetical protein
MNPNWPDREQVEMDCTDMGMEGYHGKADRMMRLMEQRDEARKCLRDVLGRFSPHDWIGMHMMIGGVHEDTLNEWRAAAGIANTGCTDAK